MSKFAPGDLILDALPFAYVTVAKAKGDICDYCFKESPALKSCTVCKMMFYCGVECQKRDWKNVHKHNECLIYSRVVSHGDKEGLIEQTNRRLLLRILITATIKKQKFTIFPDDHHKSRCLNDLMDHVEEIKKDGRRLYDFISIATDFEAVGIDFKRDELMSYYGKMECNAFTITDISNRDQGWALFIEASIFDHSCRPNAIYVFDGIRIMVRAIKDIDLSKEEVLISYVDARNLREVRKSHLKDLYYFDCNCEVCNSDIDESDLEAIKKLNLAFEELDDDEVAKRIDLTTEYITKYEKSIGNYYPEITGRLYCVIKALIRNPRLVRDEIDIETLVSKLQEYFMKTHGLEHSLHREVLQMVISQLVD